MIKKKNAFTILECLIGMTIFLLAIIPLWELMQSSFSNITVTNDDLVVNIVSSCLISEFSNKSYIELEDLRNTLTLPYTESKIYDTDIDVVLTITPKTAESNYYDFMEIGIKLKQKVRKPKLKIKEYNYTVMVPRLY